MAIDFRSGSAAKQKTTAISFLRRPSYGPCFRKNKLPDELHSAFMDAGEEFIAVDAPAQKLAIAVARRAVKHDKRRRHGHGLQSRDVQILPAGSSEVANHVAPVFEVMEGTAGDDELVLSRQSLRFVIVQLGVG